MDPLSITASIIAVLELTSTLTGYVNSVHKATKEQKALAVEAGDLFSLLIKLRCRVEDGQSDDPWFECIRLLSADSGPLKRLQTLLELLVQKIGPIPRAQIGAATKFALTWRFSKAEVSDVLSQIERLKSLIVLALNNDLLALSQAVRNDVKVLTNQTRGLQSSLDNVQNSIDKQVSSELRKKMSQWLRAPDHSSNYLTALQRRQSRTGEWLLKSSAFEAWKLAETSSIWFHGKAGCGKTILCSTALEEIINTNDTVHSFIAYFYFDFNDNEKRFGHNASRSLLSQLCNQMPDHLRKLEKLYHGCREGEQQPTQSQIWSHLMDCLTCDGHKFLVLDALDECADREQLCFQLQELLDLKDKNVHIIMTSRYERIFQQLLETSVDHSVDIQSQVVDMDIQSYIDARLEEDPLLRKWSPSAKLDIATKLMDKADGMFRWVFCQLESLKRCSSPITLRKALKTMPSDLDETYDRMLQEIDRNGELELAIWLLQWLCFSKRPLRLEEAAEVLAIHRDPDNIFVDEDRLPDPYDITGVCSSLITCAQTQTAGVIEVKLAHYSVQEYLLSDRCYLQTKVYAETCHEDISLGCLSYLYRLSEQGPLCEKLLLQYPLSRYAAEYWWQHLRQVSRDLRQTTINIASGLLLDDKSQLRTWIQLYDIYKARPEINLRLSTKTTLHPLSYAARTGLTSVVNEVLNRGASVNADDDSDRRALHEAARCGHDQVVLLLLDRGAEIDATSRIGSTALHEATVNGHESTVQLLLRKGAKVDACSGGGRTALAAAASYGHERVFQLLLDHGSNVNSSTADGRMPLHAAAWKGRESITEILLDRGAFVNAADEDGTTPLHDAALGGNEQIFQLLLERGAKISTPGRLDRTPLHVATLHGHERIVQLLLDQEADTAALDRANRTALDIASRNGSMKIAEMLRNHQARLVESQAS